MSESMEDFFKNAEIDWSKTDGLHPDGMPYSQPIDHPQPAPAVESEPEWSTTDPLYDVSNIQREVYRKLKEAVTSGEAKEVFNFLSRYILLSNNALCFFKREWLEAKLTHHLAEQNLKEAEYQAIVGGQVVGKNELERKAQLAQLCYTQLADVNQAERLVMIAESQHNRAEATHKALVNLSNLAGNLLKGLAVGGEDEP